MRTDLRKAWWQPSLYGLPFWGGLFFFLRTWVAIRVSNCKSPAMRYFGFIVNFHAFPLWLKDKQFVFFLVILFKNWVFCWKKEQKLIFIPNYKKTRLTTLLNRRKCTHWNIHTHTRFKTRSHIQTLYTDSQLQQTLICLNFFPSLHSISKWIS